MKRTQNAQTKIASEFPVYVDGADLFHPVIGEDQMASLHNELEAERAKSVYGCSRRSMKTDGCRTKSERGAACYGEVGTFR